MSERKQKVIQQLNDFISGKFLEDKEFVLKCFEIDNIIGFEEVDYNFKLDEILQDKDSTGLTWKDISFNDTDPGKLFAMWMSEGDIGDLNYGVLQDYLYSEKKNTAEAFCDTPRIMDLLSKASVDPTIATKEQLVDSIIKVFSEHGIANYQDLDQQIQEVREFKERHSILDEHNAQDMANSQGEIPPQFGDDPLDYSNMPQSSMDYEHDIEPPFLDDPDFMASMPGQGETEPAPSNAYNSGAMNAQQPSDMGNRAGQNQPSSNQQRRTNAAPNGYSNDKEKAASGKEEGVDINKLKKAMEMQQQQQQPTVKSDPISSLLSGIGKTFGLGAGLASGLLTRAVKGRDERMSPSEAFSKENLTSVCDSMKNDLRSMRGHLETLSNSEASMEDRTLAADTLAKGMDNIQKNQAKINAASNDPELRGKLAEVKAESDSLVKDMKEIKDDENTPQDIKEKLEKLIDMISKFFERIFGRKGVQNENTGPTM
ncbi:hypothetical protein [Vibrio owensii]|uniref:hypothetical protein n=1 Tax=Vibrio harveyi group TaxID=717610 RepID=UPI003CC6D70D